MKTYREILERLKEIKEGPFEPSHRKDDTGIGKTLEDLVGIKENNFAGPDGIETELKSTRKHSSSMLTLFTKSPLPRGINTKLRLEYGYHDEKFKDKLILHTTINAIDYNKIKKENGLKIVRKEDRIEIHFHRPPKKIPDMQTPYWLNETLQQHITKKYPKQLLYVKADSRIVNDTEEFHYNEAWLLRGFDGKTFFQKLGEGILDVDIRLGIYDSGPNIGKYHDHGTGIRVRPSLLDECFSHRERVL